MNQGKVRCEIDDMKTYVLVILCIDNYVKSCKRFVISDYSSREDAFAAARKFGKQKEEEYKK